MSGDKSGPVTIDTSASPLDEHRVGGAVCGYCFAAPCACPLGAALFAAEYDSAAAEVADADEAAQVAAGAWARGLLGAQKGRLS